MKLQDPNFDEIYLYTPPAALLETHRIVCMLETTPKNYMFIEVRDRQHLESFTYNPRSKVFFSYRRAA